MRMRNRVLRMAAGLLALQKFSSHAIAAISEQGPVCSLPSSVSDCMAARLSLGGLPLLNAVLRLQHAGSATLPLQAKHGAGKERLLAGTS